MTRTSGLGPRAADFRFFAVGLCLAVAASAAAHGQEPDTFYNGLAAGDTVFARLTLQDGLETHPSRELAEWRNDATGNSGSVTPVRTFRIKTGFFCRDFLETVVAAGAPAERAGTACRREDGAWIRVER